MLAFVQIKRLTYLQKVLIEERLLMKAVHLAEHPKKANEKNPTIQENKFIDILSKVATFDVCILRFTD